MNQMLSVIISLVFITIGLAAVIIMLNMQGNPKDRPSAKTLRWLHRIFGYLFLLIFMVNLVFMSKRILGLSMEPSPRLILHIALALLLIPIFMVKISISRFFKKLYAYLMPLGLIIFTIGFLMIAITSGYYLISTAEQSLNTVRTEPVKSPETDADENSSIVDAQKILLQKCAICHNLDRVKEADKDEAQWAATFERMIKYTRNPDHLSETEKSTLIKHLVQQNHP